MDVWGVLFAVIYGLVAGAAANALADELPYRRAPRLPRYPDGEPRRGLLMSGVLTFALGRRTSPKGNRLGWRHPLSEVLAVVLSLVTLNAATQYQTPVVQVVFWFVYVAFFTLIVVIDMEHHLILYVVINPFVVLALLDAVLTGAFPDTVIEALIGGAVGYGVFFLLFNGGALFAYLVGKMRGESINDVAFGYGDVMLAGVVGLILGWKAFLVAMVATILLGAVGALVVIVYQRVFRGGYSAFAAMPYGPYIVAGALLMMLYPNETIQWLIPAAAGVL
jgi:prepilin signal peptidase PulO-like enzyme (type II secretory pathway)